MGMATAITPSTVLVIEKSEMFKVLHEQYAPSGMVITFMLARNIRIEEDLIDQLFNSSEKRLARTLLLLARYGKEDQPHGVLPKPIARNACGDDRHNPVAGQFFHEQIQKIGFHEVPRRPLGQQFSVERRTAGRTHAAISSTARQKFTFVDFLMR
jgi:CRP/FNR family transcriptional regulator, cyclic AMP receptor protein